MEQEQIDLLKSLEQRVIKLEEQLKHELSRTPIDGKRTLGYEISQLQQQLTSLRNPPGRAFS